MELYTVQVDERGLSEGDIQYHGGYPENRNVRYASHNMADAEPGKKQLWPLRNHVAYSGLFSHWYQ